MSDAISFATRSTKRRSLGQLYANLGVTKTHSRPHVSNDNPFSESQFKTLKYRPEFPKRFGSPEEGVDLILSRKRSRRCNSGANSTCRSSIAA